MKNALNRSLSAKSVFIVPLLLILVLGCNAVAATQYQIIAPVINMYSGPSADTDVVSQAIYATLVSSVEEQDNWVKIKTPGDDYVGWVERSSLSPAGEKVYPATADIAEVHVLMAHLYREPDVTAHAPVITLPFETHLEIAQSKNNEARWLQVRLLDSRLLWIQKGDVEIVAQHPQKSLSIPEMVSLSKHFLGLPYTWGGSSSFGYDCSGFVQMLMRQRGYLIPRDADVQAAWDGFKPVKPSELLAGDVLYFGSKGKITHTGMYIGNGEFIHATTHDHPVIQISRLDDKPWPKLLIAQRRVKQ